MGCICLWRFACEVTICRADRVTSLLSHELTMTGNPTQLHTTDTRLHSISPYGRLFADAFDRNRLVRDNYRTYGRWVIGGSVELLVSPIFNN